MIIKGFQKTTLLDYPEHVACTVFTGGCNFRCPFCHNASLVTHTQNVDNVDENDILTYIKKRKGILDGVCVTGGEPLLMTDIGDFLLKIKELGLKVKLDTNGSFPDRLESLIDSGLVDYVAMDIKNSFEKYALTAGTKEFPSDIKKSIKIIMDKAPDYEFRTTVVRELHTAQDIESITQYIVGAKRYFLQTYVDSGDILCGEFSAYSEPEMLSLLDRARVYLPVTKLRGI